MPEKRRGIACDLFAGGGGLSFGAEQGGFDVAFGADIDPSHVAAHQVNTPYAEGVVTDLAHAHGDDLRRGAAQENDIDMLGLGNPVTAAGGITAVFGGPPCQGLSEMGRKDVDDPRNQLMDHFVRLVYELQPRYAVAENVPGLLQDRNRPIWDRLVDRIEQSGYRLVTPVQQLYAPHFGVPQGRERVLLLLYRQGETPPEYPAPTHAVDPVAAADQGFFKPAPTVADALDDLPDADTFEELLERDFVQIDPDDYPTPSPYALRLRDGDNDPDDLSYPRIWDPSMLTCSKRTQHNAATRARYAEVPAGGKAPGHNLPRLAPNGLAPTLRAGNTAKVIDGVRHSSHTAPRPIHHRHHRVITVREAMRLSGYPDWYRMHPSKLQGFRQVGNSVPPPMARAVANEIRKAAELAPEKPQDPIALGDPDLLNHPRQRLRCAA